MDRTFLDGPADSVAPRLIGCELLRTFPDGSAARLKIVETEAYDQGDAASHSYKGRTPRTDVMFGQSGRLYVYFTYGMHFCMNIVCGPAGYGAAVLIRAAEPLAGRAVLAQHRPGRTGVDLTNGPAKLCQALAVDRSLNGHSTEVPPLQLIVRPPTVHTALVQTARIGISQERHRLWRWHERGNPYVSHT